MRKAVVGMSETAFLSARVPSAMRDRVKALAASRGASVQQIVAGLVENWLEREDYAAPLLADVVVSLRARHADLRARGVDALWVFGSVARGNARRDSDVDLLVRFDPGKKISMTGFGSLREDLAAALGRPVDLAEIDMLLPEIAEAARRDGVQIF